MTYEAGASGADCRALFVPEPPATLEISRAGSAVRSSAHGLDLTGTLYDNATFVVTGHAAVDGGTDSLVVRGQYLPPSAALDAGARIRGTWSGDHRREGKSCSIDRPFVATRN